MINSLSPGFNPKIISVLLSKTLPSVTGWNSGLLNSFISTTPVFPSLVMIVLFGIVKALGMFFSKKDTFKLVWGDSSFSPVINLIVTWGVFILFFKAVSEKTLVTCPWNSCSG